MIVPKCFAGCFSPPVIHDGESLLVNFRNVGKYQILLLVLLLMDLKSSAGNTQFDSNTAALRPKNTDDALQIQTHQKFSTLVTCSENEMTVDLVSTKPDVIAEAYLQGWKNYPDPACSPVIDVTKDRHSFKFRLSLGDLTFYRCGTNLMTNKITGTRTYYNRLEVVVHTTALEDSNRNLTGVENVQRDESNIQTVLVKCQFANTTTFNHNNRIRRDVLPAGFQEADVLRLNGIKTGRAPDPLLTMRVRQEGRVIGQELLVQPGTPLTMEVANIDEKMSRQIYGILMSQMDATDNAALNEMIILNGCTVDPYLFENFKTADGDLLAAKFRAFKFPESNYVLFRGTVNVCLDSCEPTDCSNGQQGYGRRRRDTSSHEKDRLYEVQMTTLLRMAESDNEMNPVIVGTKSNLHHHYDNNAMTFSLLRKAREQDARVVPVASANRAISVNSMPPSYALLVILSLVTSGVLATTLVLVRS